jgi:hypothetical protein
MTEIRTRIETDEEKVAALEARAHKELIDQGAEPLVDPNSDPERREFSNYLITPEGNIMEPNGSGGYMVRRRDVDLAIQVFSR